MKHPVCFNAKDGSTIYIPEPEKIVYIKVEGDDMEICFDNDHVVHVTRRDANKVAEHITFKGAEPEFKKW